jgi:hypothetical protein
MEIMIFYWERDKMERLLMNELIKWKNKSKRKPLIIHGARQVGKTWLMQEFGRRYYKDYIYISFDNNDRMKNTFEQDFDIKRILSAIKIESGKNIDSNNTLLIFDEIQEVPKAMTSLKYFYENAPEYSIIAAGSLLGMALHEGSSFPVGKVDFMYLHPLNFREFLMAVGENDLSELLTTHDYDMVNTFSSKYTDWLRKYYYVGGMPEAVQTFIDTDDMGEVRTIQKQLLLYYENDFSKHSPIEHLPRIQMVWNSIPAQLSKENRKFIYGIVREGARAKDYEIAIQWLTDYGLIYKSYRVSKPGMPLISYIDQSSFKMFMLDVGLLTAKGNIPAKTLLEGNRIFEEFKGALTEQYVAQEFASYNMDLYYYSADNSSCEIDFIVQHEDYTIPLEVKSETNLKAQSLHSFCQKYKPDVAIRSSMTNYHKEEWVDNVPLYLVAEYIGNLL